MRNLMRITYAINKQQAWEDWRKLAATAPELAAKFAPPETAGIKKIDAAIEMLRAAIQEPRP